MRSIHLKQNISQIYLSIVPFLTAIFGFGAGHISYKIYLPIWILNAGLMATSAWYLGFQASRKADKSKKQLALGGVLLIVPWVLLSIFFGFGPPPEKAVDWVATANEQQIRYSLLIVAGVFIAIGFGL